MLYGPPGDRDGDGDALGPAGLGAGPAATGEPSPAATAPIDFSSVRRPIFGSSMNGSFQRRPPTRPAHHQGVIERRKLLRETAGDESGLGSERLEAHLHHPVPVAPWRSLVAQPEQGLAKPAEDDVHGRLGAGNAKLPLLQAI